MFSFICQFLRNTPTVILKSETFPEKLFTDRKKKRKKSSTMVESENVSGKIGFL